jgi:hypothetical protein
MSQAYNAQKIRVKNVSEKLKASKTLQKNYAYKVELYIDVEDISFKLSKKDEALIGLRSDKIRSSGFCRYYKSEKNGNSSRTMLGNGKEDVHEE